MGKSDYNFYKLNFQGYPPQSGPGFVQPPQPNYGGDDPSVKGFEFNDASIRRAFIRKVYAILGVSRTLHSKSVEKLILLIILLIFCRCNWELRWHSLLRAFSTKKQIYSLGSTPSYFGYL